MRAPSVLLAIALAALGGCSKKTPPPAPAASAAPAAPDVPGVPAPVRPRAAGVTAVGAEPAPLPAESQALVGIEHEFMTQQLRIFVQERGRLPTSFSEFASARMDSVPRPPPGLKYAIDAQSVSVKLVRQ